MDHVEAGSSNHFDNRIIYLDPFSVYIIQYMALRRRVQYTIDSHGAEWMEGFSITELDPPDSRKSNYRRGINATNKRIEYLYTEGFIQQNQQFRLLQRNGIYVYQNASRAYPKTKYYSAHGE